VSLYPHFSAQSATPECRLNLVGVTPHTLRSSRQHYSAVSGAVFPALCQLDDGMVVIIALDDALLSATKHKHDQMQDPRQPNVPEFLSALRARPAIRQIYS